MIALPEIRLLWSDLRAQEMAPERYEAIARRIQALEDEARGMDLLDERTRAEYVLWALGWLADIRAEQSEAQRQQEQARRVREATVRRWREGLARREVHNPRVQAYLDAVGDRAIRPDGSLDSEGYASWLGRLRAQWRRERGITGHVPPTMEADFDEYLRRAG